jgi:Ser-tRNA(Ala) deacylase AlaX
MCLACDAMRNTEKLYYKDQYLLSATTSVTRVHVGAIELDATVAYPEGGGQEADFGIIILPIGVLRFTWVKKLYGSPILLEGFKGGKSGGIILHIIHPEDVWLIDKVIEGMIAEVRIDILRRQRLTLSHSASHFLYAAAVDLSEDLKNWTIGCHIKESSARFDFLVEEPFGANDILQIERQANEWIACNEVIEIYEVDGVQDARLWAYQSIKIPCGGTHLDSPSLIGPLSVRRKRVGKNKERLICEFPHAKIELSRYHERISW